MRIVARSTAFVLTCLLAGAVSPAHPQIVHGKVAERGSNAPVPSTMVVLLDSAGRAIGGGFTDERGAYSIRAPGPGRYSLRVQRLGLQDVDTAPFELARDQVLEQAIVASYETLTLPALTVQAQRRCELRPDQGYVATVWAEAKKALFAVALTERQSLYRFRVRTYERQLEVPGLLTVRDSTRTSTQYAQTSPFKSAAAAQLIERGFIDETAANAIYYAPDAHVLLSDEFTSAYCFRVAQQKRDSLIGVTFEPAEQRGPAAVRGTLWLDATTYEARYLEYHYTRAQLPAGGANLLGGRVEFERLPAGTWIVRNWYIRMPAAVTERRTRTGLGPDQVQRTLVALNETGGEILEVVASGARITAATLATVSGVVVDSISGAPLGGATVFLAGTRYATTTDAQGRFTLAELPAGNFALTFTHPKLGVYDVVPAAVPLTLASGARLDVNLAVPASATALRCPATTQPRRADEHGIVIGWARDEVTGVLLSGAQVEISWQRAGESARTSARASAGADGAYVICGVPADRPLATSIRYLGREAAGPPLAALGSSGFAEHDVTMRIARPGSLMLQLNDRDSGRPIVNAAVALPSLNRRAVSDAQGRVTFDDVPAGEHRLVFEHIGYGTHERNLVAGTGSTVLDVSVPARALALDSIEVKVRPQRSAADAARRSRGVRNSLLVRAEIEDHARTALNLADLLRRLPALRINESVLSHRNVLCVESRRGATSLELGQTCAYVAIMLDGVMIVPPNPHDVSGELGERAAAAQRDNFEQRLRDLPLNAIESIEYFTSAEAGARFGTGSAGGVLVIYTRGNGPYAERR